MSLNFSKNYFKGEFLNMSNKAEMYEMLDEVIKKERNIKGKEVKETQKNLKGGEGFICNIECKKCGNG
jgi:hypothetical protein